MCFFGKKPKMKSPKIQTPRINQAAPIADQTPKVVEGSDAADTERSQKRRSASPGLSLFQIQLLPGVTSTTAEEPGAATGEF